VYSLKTDEWISEYTAPVATSPGANPSMTSPTSITYTVPTTGGSLERDTGTSGTIGVRIGEVVGALVIGFTLGTMVGYYGGKRRFIPTYSAATSIGDNQSSDDIRKETVQVGSCGTRPEDQHPHASL
jgi:hypothetical protein